jgi:hypothetical protein
MRFGNQNQITGNQITQNLKDETMKNLILFTIWVFKKEKQY